MEMEFRELASGLLFPEGPVILADGSVVLVEIGRGTVTKVAPDGAVSYLSQQGGGPNGLALGPDGKIYICNNGGFSWIPTGKMIARLLAIGRPTTIRAARSSGSTSQSGEVETALSIDAMACALQAARTTSCSTTMAASGSPISARRRAREMDRRRRLLSPRPTA